MPPLSTLRLSPRKTKASVLCFLFLLSLFSNLSLHTPTTAIAPTAPSMNSGESLGLHSSSAISIGEMTNVTFDVSEAPYRWFSTTGKISGITHLNITANTSTNDYWETGSITAYTAADRCVSSVFYVGYGIETQCSNPSLDPTILFSIDFFDSQEMMSVLDDNLSFTITVEQHVEDTAPPSNPLPYNYSDGDINSDSSTWLAPLVFLDEAPSTMVGGYFESEFDTDTIRYQTNYSGTHRLNVSINQQVNPTVFDELSDCQISDSGGHQMVKDINSGWSGSSISGLTAVGNTLYFQANDGLNGNELWKSDGTEAGTMMVKDINSGWGGSSSGPAYFTAIGNTLYFQANDGGNGAELWKSDGTEAGTMIVKDIYSGGSSSSPTYLTAVGNTVYFRADDATNGDELHSYKEPNGQPQTFIDCLVTSVNGMAQFSFSPLTPVTSPMPWIASITFEQVHPLEDPARGDSDGSSLYPPLLEPISVTDGVFNSFGDSDRFAIPIQHGTMQSIQIHTQSNSVFSLLSSSGGNCFSDPTFITVDPSSSFDLESEWVSNTFICDTRYFTDEIQFQISQTISGGELSYLPYQITLSTSNLENISSSAMEQSIFDPPARGIVPVLNVNENVNGSFLHWSDQTDRYEIQLEPDASAQVQFLSNCATMTQYSGKNSVLEILTLSQASPIIIQRLQSSNIHDADLKDTCTYSLQVSEYTPAPVSYSTYSFTYDGRFHPTRPIQISNISEYLPSHIVSNDISMSMPFDLLPTTDGIIQATQISGNPVTLQLSGTQYRGSEIGNMSVGQHIDFGSPRVQWTTLTLSGLDGSELQVQFTEQNLLTYTKESSELYSMGNGALGSSLDEGWDGEDTFTLNNSASMATFASVQISTLSEGFKASFSGSSISQLLCFDTSNPMAQILHQQGDGEYTLNVARGFTSCPSVTLSAPTTVSESSQFTVQYTDWNNENLSLTVKLFDENLDLIYQNFDTNPIKAIELPAHVTEGMYHLLLVDESNIVYAERKLHVVHDPLQFVQPTKTILDVNEAPQIHIQSFMHHSREPVDWTFTNITLTTISQTGAIITQSLDEEYTGLGAKVVTLTNLPEVMPGSILHVQADLYAGEEVTKYSLSWKKVFFEPSITCETELIPDQTLPENDVLCLVSLHGKVHGVSSNELTEFQVEGTLDIFDEQFELIQQIDFSSNLFRSTPIRIDSIELGTGHFFAKVNISSTANLYLTEEVEGFEIGSFITSENDSQQILGTYDLTIISIRDTALAGDDIVLTWQTTGEETAYFWIEVYGDNDIVQTLSLLNDGSTNGNFKIKLPNDVNPYMTHSITVHAYSTYGSVDSKSVNIQGMNQQTYLDVNINPDRPKLGSNFNVELLLSTDDSWLSWNWALYKSSLITPSDILSEGDGFELDNSAKFSVHLPLSQYTSSPYLHLEVESEDGSLFYETIRILPLPLRSITLDMDSEMILDKMYDVEWELEGQYLNTLDNVERIEFAIYSMDYELYLEEVYSVNTTNGEFETRVPSSLTPGSHFVLIEFTFADGDTYEHSQIITVLSSPPGINIFALNIPPLALGLDTILVVILIGHAVFLHRRSSKKQQGDDTVFSDEHLDVEDKEIPEFTEDYEDYGEIDSGPKADEYPMYQEHPAGSGHHWVKYSSELEWEYIEI